MYDNWLCFLDGGRMSWEMSYSDEILNITKTVIIVSVNFLFKRLNGKSQFNIQIKGGRCDEN